MAIGVTGRVAVGATVGIPGLIAGIITGGGTFRVALCVALALPLRSALSYRLWAISALVIALRLAGVEGALAGAAGLAAGVVAELSLFESVLVSVEDSDFAAVFLPLSFL